MSKGTIISAHIICLGNHINIDIHRAMFSKIFFKEYHVLKEI